MSGKKTAGRPAPETVAIALEMCAASDTCMGPPCPYFGCDGGCFRQVMRDGAATIREMMVDGDETETVHGEWNYDER